MDEYIEVHPDKILDGDISDELCISHSGVSKHIGEAVELPGYSVLFYCTETSKIELCRFPVSFSK